MVYLLCVLEHTEHHNGTLWCLASIFKCINVMGHHFFLISFKPLLGLSEKLHLITTCNYLFWYQHLLYLSRVFCCPLSNARSTTVRWYIYLQSKEYHFRLIIFFVYTKRGMYWICLLYHGIHCFLDVSFLAKQRLVILNFKTEPA